MRCRVAFALIVAVAAIPACAQRGGAGHGGFGGHAGSAFHGGFSAPNHSSGSYGFAARGVPATGYALRGGSPRVQSGWADAMGRMGYRYGNRYRRPYFPVYGYGVAVPYTIPWTGLLGPDYLSYPDEGGYGDSQAAPDYAPQGDVANPPYAPPQADMMNAPGMMPAPGGPPFVPDEAAPAAPEGYETPPPPDRPAARRPYQPSGATSPNAAAPAEEAVTLIFKDGRPPAQVRNYILTGAALYVQDETRRSIPLDQLDLAATVRANQEAGIDFQIPRN